MCDSMKKEDQLISGSVPLGTSIPTMATKEYIIDCLANTRWNLISIVEEVLYDPLTEKEENKRSHIRDLDRIAKELTNHVGPNCKKGGGSRKHLDQVQETETKECSNDAFVSYKKILVKEKEEVENVFICPKNEKIIASVLANRGVDEIDLPVSFEIRRESCMKKDVSMDSVLTGTDSIVGQQKSGNEPFVNDNSNNSSGGNRVPTPENPGVVMAKIAQSSQLVGVIGIRADTNFPNGALRHVQQKILNDSTADDKPIMPLEKKDLSDDVVSRSMATKMTPGAIENDWRQMCGHFVGQTYVWETYLRKEFSNRKRERKEKNEQTYVPSAKVQNGVPSESDVMTDDARSTRINKSILCVRKAKVPTLVPPIDAVTYEIRSHETKNLGVTMTIAKEELFHDEVFQSASNTEVRILNTSVIELKIKYVSEVENKCDHRVTKVMTKKVNTKEIKNDVAGPARDEKAAQD